MARAAVQVLRVAAAILCVCFVGLACQYIWTIWIYNLENVIPIDMSEIVITGSPRGSEGRCVTRQADCRIEVSYQCGCSINYFNH